AAARIRLLSPPAMLVRLQSAAGGLPFLNGGARDRPERQQTLRRAIAWSYDLLDSDAQALFRLLAAFVGGCTLDAAERVVGARLNVLDGLQSLVANCLLRQDARPDIAEPRFVMLETIREYALE